MVQIVKKQSRSTKNASLNKKSANKRDEIDKDYLKYKLHNNSFTTVPSKLNSNLTSRTEEQLKIVTINYKNKIFPKTTTHSPTNTFKCNFIYSHNNLNSRKGKNSMSNKKIKYKKNNIQKPIKKKAKGIKENNFKQSYNNNNNSKIINTDNILLVNNFINEKEVKRNETEHITIQKSFIDKNDNKRQHIHNESSFQSTSKDKTFFINERNKIAEYIRNYYEKEGDYPISNIHFYK